MRLPQLLAGPILRRVEKDRVCLWLATSQKVQVEGQIFIVDKNEKNNKEMGTEGQFPLKCIGKSKKERTEIVQLGKQLFITLLFIYPLSEQFPLDSILFYDVTIGKKSLKNLGLLDHENGITYPDMALPNFFLPSKMCNLLHGSCRKPHGPGDDTLAKADNLISKSADNSAKRPAVLFLTGDQIYADDVAGPLIGILSRYGEALTGLQEDIPALGNPSILPVFSRNEALENANTGFTSGHSDNHLLTFAEFAAMYLMVWSDNKF